MKWRDELFKRLSAYGTTPEIRRAAVESLESARAEGYAQAREQAAEVCETDEVPLDGSWLLNATKRDVGAKVAVALAERIRAMQPEVES